jgi:hypothetical protein
MKQKLTEEEKKYQEKDRRLFKTYGIGYDAFLTQLDSQGRVCMICKRGGDIRLCQDHIHVKGFKKMEPKEKRKYLRGILCFMCNTLIGKMERTNDGELNRLRMLGCVEYFKKYAIKGEI